MKTDKEGKLDTRDREDDLEFLKDQRGPRIGWMSGRDTLYETSVGNKVSRENKEYDDEKSIDS